MVEYARTELMPTIVFDGPPRIDTMPVITDKGRVIPGAAYSARELAMLKVCAELGMPIL